MTTCANCTAPAAFTYRITEASAIHYCIAHLPKFLNAQKNSGLLKLDTPVVEEVVIETPKSSKKKTTVVVEETPVEEVVVEEAPVEPVVEVSEVTEPEDAVS